MTVSTKKVLNDLIKLKRHPNIIDKINISKTYRHLGASVASSSYFEENKDTIKLGDDTAAIKQPDGSYLLYAAEGIIEEFLDNDPWFAGYSAIMVNISDICAMGGLPIAVTNTIYAKNEASTSQVWEGMLAASSAYGVPIVGGHTCYHSTNKALSVSILGKSSKHLLTSFDAVPGQELLLAINMNGTYYKEYPFWNASTATPPKLLRSQVKTLYQIADKQLSGAAKDVSMGGIIGTLYMLMHTSNVGAEINLEAISKPQGVPWDKWLISFPSFGYLLTAQSKDVNTIKTIFSEKEIHCTCIGTITTTNSLYINYYNEKIKL